MFGLCARDGEGSRADWSELGGARFGVTGLGGFRSLRAGLVIKAGDAGYEIGTPLSVP